MSFNSNRDTRASPFSVYYAPRLRLLLIVGRRKYLVARGAPQRCRTVRESPTISRDKTLCLRPLISIVFARRSVRLQRVIASAIQSPRNYRAITRASRPAGEYTRQPRSNSRIVDLDQRLFPNPRPSCSSLLIHIIWIHNWTSICNKDPTNIYEEK